MNTIGVATYDNGSQGLVDYVKLLTDYHKAACILYKQEWRREKFIGTSLANYCYCRGIKTLAVHYMDGRRKSVIIHRV